MAQRVRLPGNLWRTFCFVALLATATTVVKSVEVHGLNWLFGENATVAVATENNNRLLDDAFCAMCDLDFRTAEDKRAILARASR